MLLKYRYFIYSLYKTLFEILLKYGLNILYNIYDN